MELTHLLLSFQEMRLPLPTYVYITHVSFLLTFTLQRHTEQLRYGFDESKYIDYHKSNKDEDKTVKRSNAFAKHPFVLSPSSRNRAERSPSLTTPLIINNKEAKIMT